MRTLLSAAFTRAAWTLATLALACIACPAAGNAPRAAGSGISLRWFQDPADTNQWLVRAFGLGAATLEALQRTEPNAQQWRDLMPVSVETGSLIQDVGLPPMLGRYEVTSEGITFKPQFPMEHGVTYRATLWAGRLPRAENAEVKPFTAAFELPPRQLTSGTVVAQVFPSADTVPENLLKFYIHFSAPMSRGHVYDHIQLRNETGTPVELPFLELDEELWNPAMTRLTLFIDPGRIKRGVTPLEEVGPALEEGKRFTLVIDRSWKDSQGQPLKESFRKQFRVGPADRDPPDPATWTVTSPKPSSRDPLRITFPESMDHALAQRVIQVVNHAGKAVPGQVTMAQQEKLWAFLPEHQWIAGELSILVQTTIEDLAGNNIGKRFEVDTFERIERRLTNTTVKLPLHIQ